VHRRAKPFLFSFFTDRATQVQFLAFDYFTEKRGFTAETSRAPRNTSFISSRRPRLRFPNYAVPFTARWPLRPRKPLKKIFLCALGVSAVKLFPENCTVPDANCKSRLG
jgi:hypothetical protein